MTEAGRAPGTDYNQHAIATLTDRYRSRAFDSQIPLSSASIARTI
jgi:hypothetical protein